MPNKIIDIACILLILACICCAFWLISMLSADLRAEQACLDQYQVREYRAINDSVYCEVDPGHWQAVKND